MGYNGNPPRWHVAEGIARPIVVLRGTANRVHVRRGRTRRVHVFHAPAPGMIGHGLRGAVIGLKLLTRADAQGSPPLAACTARTVRVGNPVLEFVHGQQLVP